MTPRSCSLEEGGGDKQMAVHFHDLTQPDTATVNTIITNDEA